MAFPPKTNFDHTLITSQFLNDLQDYVLERHYPQVLLYMEGSGNQVPASAGGTAQLTDQGVLPDIVVIPGDIVIGTGSGAIAVVTDVVDQDIVVTGLGIGLG